MTTIPRTYQAWYPEEEEEEEEEVTIRYTTLRASCWLVTGGILEPAVLSVRDEAVAAACLINDNHECANEVGSDVTDGNDVISCLDQTCNGQN